MRAPATAPAAVPASAAQLQALLADNAAQVRALAALDAKLLARREHLQARLLALRAAERAWRAKQQALDDGLREFSPPALYRRLRAAADDQDALCRSLAASFVDGDGAGSPLATERELADFVRRFRDAAKTAVLRREWKHRWDEGRVGGWR